MALFSGNSGTKLVVRSPRGIVIVVYMRGIKGHTRSMLFTSQENNESHCLYFAVLRLLIKANYRLVRVVFQMK